MVAKKTKPKTKKTSGKRSAPDGAQKAKLSDKAVKKKPVKKKPAKKTTTKKSKLRNAKPRHHFVLRDGRHIRNLLDLADAMDEMTDEIFFHHVNDFKNDFAAWVSEVFEDHDLSERLSKVKTRHRHQIEILKHEIKRLIK